MDYWMTRQGELEPSLCNKLGFVTQPLHPLFCDKRTHFFLREPSLPTQSEMVFDQNNQSTKSPIRFWFWNYAMRSEFLQRGSLGEWSGTWDYVRTALKLPGAIRREAHTVMVDTSTSCQVLHGLTPRCLFSDHLKSSSTPLSVEILLIHQRPMQIFQPLQRGKILLVRMSHFFVLAVF